MVEEEQRRKGTTINEYSNATNLLFHFISIDQDLLLKLMFCHQ